MPLPAMSEEVLGSFVSVKLSVHHFNIAKSYHQMFPLNLSIPIILVCFKAVVHHDFKLFVCLFVASPPPQLCSEICRYICITVKSSSSKSGFSKSGAWPWWTSLHLYIHLVEWDFWGAIIFNLKIWIPRPWLMYIVFRPVSVIQLKLTVFPEQWSRWRNL